MGIHVLVYIYLKGFFLVKWDIQPFWLRGGVESFDPYTIVPPKLNKTSAFSELGIRWWL